MRLFIYALLCALLFVPVGMAQEIQEQTQTDEPEPIIIYTLSDRIIDLTALAPIFAPKRSHWKEQWDDWHSVPQLTVSMYKGNGFFVPRYWYRIQDRHIDIQTRTWGGDFRSNRFFVSGQLTHMPERTDITSRSLEFRVTPIRLWQVRPGFGYWRNDSRDAQELFANGDSSIMTGTKHISGAYVVDLGISGYNRSYLRLVGMYGNVRVTTNLELQVSGQTQLSPLALRNDDNSDFTAFGAQAALRRWGFSLEGSAIEFRPRWASIAMSRECRISSVVASYTTPFPILHIGIFAKTTRISNVPVGTRSSLQFINDGWIFGLSARIP